MAFGGQITKLHQFFFLFIPFQFCKLQASTYVVNHAWVNFHPIIIKFLKNVKKCSTRGFLAFCDQIIELHRFFSLYIYIYNIILFYFILRFRKLQASTYLVNHVLLKFHQIIIK